MAIDDLVTMKPVAPPPIVEDLAELNKPPARLSINGKTRNLDLLAKFPPVEAVWVNDVNQRQFGDILPLLNPAYLIFNGMRVADLSPLGELTGLQALEIHWNTKVEDLSFLAKLTKLRLLALIHCSKIHDLAPIRELTNLEILDLGGGMWSTFRPETLAPLRNLKNLRGLSLKNIRVGDESLEPVTALKQLREIELSNQFPAEEYARLSVAFPDIDCPHFKPYLDFGAGTGAKQVMVTGKRGPVLSLPQDASRLERYVRRFHELQEKFRA